MFWMAATRCSSSCTVEKVSTGLLCCFFALGRGVCTDAYGGDHLEEVGAAGREGLAMVHDETAGEEPERLLLLQRVRESRHVCVELESPLTVAVMLREKRQEVQRDERLHELDRAELPGCPGQSEQGEEEAALVFLLEVSKDVVAGVVQGEEERFYAYEQLLVFDHQALRVRGGARELGFRVRGEQLLEDWRGLGEDFGVDDELDEGGGVVDGDDNVSILDDLECYGFVEFFVGIRGNGCWIRERVVVVLGGLRHGCWCKLALRRAVAVLGSRRHVGWSWCRGAATVLGWRRHVCWWFVMVCER